MATPGESVYLGREGTGEAQILGGPAKDPLAFYMAQRQAQAANALKEQELATKNDKQKNAEVLKLINRKYEDPGERFRAWSAARQNSTNSQIFDLLQANPDADISELTPMISALQGEHMKENAYAAEMNNVYNEKLKLLNDIDHVDPVAAQAMLGKIFNQQSPYDVDREKLDHIEQIPGLYNLNSMVASSVKDIKDQYNVQTPGELESTGLGQIMKLYGDKRRFGDIEKVMDFTLGGNDISDFGRQQKAMGGRIADNILYNIAASEVQDPNDEDQVMARFKQIQYDKAYNQQIRDRLKPILQGLDQTERGVRVQNLGKFKQPSLKEQEYVSGRNTRENDLNLLIDPFQGGKLSTASPEAKKAVGKLLGGSMGGKKIKKAEFKRGGYKLDPESSAKLAQLIESKTDDVSRGVSTLDPDIAEVMKNAKKVPVEGNGDKISFTLQSSGNQWDELLAEPIELDLKDPSAQVILNAVMNQNQGERRYYFNDLFGGGQQQSYLDDDDENEYLD